MCFPPCRSHMVKGAHVCVLLGIAQGSLCSTSLESKAEHGVCPHPAPALPCKGCPLEEPLACTKGNWKREGESGPGQRGREGRKAGNRGWQGYGGGGHRMGLS